MQIKYELFVDSVNQTTVKCLIKNKYAIKHIHSNWIIATAVENFYSLISKCIGISWEMQSFSSESFTFARDNDELFFSCFSVKKWQQIERKHLARQIKQSKNNRNGTMAEKSGSKGELPITNSSPFRLCLYLFSLVLCNYNLRIAKVIEMFEWNKP